MKSSLLALLILLESVWHPGGGETLGACSGTLSGLAETVAFQGAVTPIVEPLVLRYRPYPRTTFSMTQDMTQDLGGAAFSVRTTATGSTKVERSGADLIGTVAVDRTVVVYGDRRQQTEWGAVATIRLSDRGELGEVKSEDQKFRRLVSRLSRKLYARLPEGGVKTGDELLSLDMDLSAFAGLGATVRGKSARVVRGMAKHESRRVIVLDLTLVIETTGPGMNGSGTGYGLLDAETGAWLYSEFSVAIDGVMDGQPMTFKMTEVTKTGF